MKIVIAGATGLIGKALCVHLLKLNNEVHALVRDPVKVNFLPKENIHQWNMQDSLQPNLVQNIDALIHLAGEPVAESRWSEEQKKRILESRVVSTKKIVDSIRSLEPQSRPKVFICASAIGFYGDRGDQEITETDEAGTGFLAEVTKSWEATAKEISELGVRLVLLRTGVVLASEGGALSKMLPVQLGSGKQWMSWIHLEDELGFIEFAIQQSTVEGAYNLVSPNPVTNSEFCNIFAKLIHFPKIAQISVPKFLLRSGLGEMAQVILASQKVLPKRILESGYRFRYVDLNSALLNIYPDQNYLSSNFQSVQFVPQKIDHVFSFFSRAENLEEITPPWLNFKIVSKSTENIQDHTKINYRLKVHGIPMFWQSQIEKWEPGVRFVDQQLKGPYSKWCHEHKFFPVNNGTLMVDQVSYRVPGFALGKLFLGNWIGNDIKSIFNYRTKVIAERFSNKNIAE